MSVVCWCAAGELDRVRSGYYPSLFYPKVQLLHAVFEDAALGNTVMMYICIPLPEQLRQIFQIGKLNKTFIPNFEAASYIHNFKDTSKWCCLAGALFRCYPGVLLLLCISLLSLEPAPHMCTYAFLHYAVGCFVSLFLFFKCVCACRSRWAPT